MKIVDRLPYESQGCVERTHFGEVLILHHQVMVWVHVSAPGVRPSPNPIPAILDTGFNHHLAINESHLDWLKVTLDQLPVWGHTIVSRQKVALRVADVFLQPNVRGRKVISATEPVKLAVSRILVYPRGEQPRVPILGLRALTDSNLRMVIDGRRRLVSIDSGRCCESLRG